MLSGEVGRVPVQHGLAVGAVDLIGAREVEVSCLLGLVVGDVRATLHLYPVNGRHGGCVLVRCGLALMTVEHRALAVGVSATSILMGYLTTQAPHSVLSQS